jgi:DeoR/GlpR family transcriptional regulator of sugar metabolism
MSKKTANKKNKERSKEPVVSIARRRFIIEQLRGRQRLSLDELRVEFPKLTRQALHEDLSALNRLGIHIVKSKSGDLIDANASYNEAATQRAELSVREKKMVAVLVRGLVFGHAAIPLEGEPAAWKTKEDILACANVNVGTSAEESTNKLRLALADLWRERSRMIALDCGTTSDVVAELLKGVPFPYRKTDLCHLTVCTNSRHIFQMLGEQEVPIRTIAVGGQQRWKTPAVAGALAEFFLRGAGLNFGMGIIGSTNLSADEGLCYADSQEEASLKNIFLGKCGNLRIVVADNSKLSMAPRGQYAFSPIDGQHIDAIVTNYPIALEHCKFETEAEREYQARSLDGFSKAIAKIQSRGVPVLLAHEPICCERLVNDGAREDVKAITGLG